VIGRDEQNTLVVHAVGNSDENHNEAVEQLEFLIAAISAVDISDILMPLAKPANRLPI
jgi:hypothetical protein